MTGLVLDASVVLAWAFDGEVRAEDAASLMRRVARTSAVVPGHWRLEVGNVLLFGERRGRIAPNRVDAFLREILALPIELDAATDDNAWSGSIALARKHALTLYDAAYLELAIRRSLPLATFDAPLARAWQPRASHSSRAEPRLH